MLHWSMTDSKNEGRLPQNFTISTEKIKMSIVRSYQCCILSLLNILSCSKKQIDWTEKVFLSGKLTQNMSQPKERAKKVQLLEENPHIFQCHQSHRKFPHWSQEIIFLSLPSCICRVHFTKSGVDYSLFDALLPHEEPCRCRTASFHQSELCRNS